MTDEITVTAWLPLALGIINQFEGCRLKAYPDPGSGGDPWTIGFGSTGAGIERGVTWTQSQADARLADDVARFGGEVARALGEHGATACQKAAMVSLAYNIGIGNFSRSTVLRMHLMGDTDAAADAFGSWNRAAGKVMAGLTRRRAAEAALYRGQV